MGPRLANDPVRGFTCDVTIGNSIAVPSQLNALADLSTGNSPLSYSELVFSRMKNVLNQKWNIFSWKAESQKFH